MAFITRSIDHATAFGLTLGRALVRALALALTVAACAGQPNATECVTGITCPEGTKCAAAQQVCITNDCGDGIVAASEQCDDGNILDGDGCAANCLSREVCGDSVLNSAAGELCDDGNTLAGDGCADDCRSVEICGNMVRDLNEACDDGNTLPGDGCSGNCKSTEICGNGIVDLNEKCDDANAAGGCNDDCQGGTGCGDGAIDISGGGVALEECDDGNQDNQDDCTNACDLNTCGDGIVQLSGARVESCEPVGGPEDADCNLDCTTQTCGDNKINKAAGEECDLGMIGVVNQNGNDRDCTAVVCKLNVCGDGNVNTAGTLARREGCDDQNKIQTDGCSNACSLPTCGNGIVEMGENCDDSNDDSGDGCSGSESATTADHCRLETCGDGIINNGETCDDAGESSTCDDDCTSPSCGDGVVNEADAEQCDDPATPGNSDACTDGCLYNVCNDGFPGPGELCDDGNDDNTDGCTTGCTTPSCSPPNGVREDTEQCDDGNQIDTDGCLSTCVYAVCGDGKVQASVEECDQGTANNGQNMNCLADCTLNVCGDGFVDLEGTGASQTEACDLGAFNEQTTCPYGLTSCQTCTNNCDMAGTGSTDFCGDRTTDTTFGEVCDDGSPMQSCGQCTNACNHSTPAAKARAFLIASDNGGGNIGDGDVIVLNDGINTVTFEFDKDSPATITSGNVRIDIDDAGTLSPATVRTRIDAAIDGVNGLLGLFGGFRIESLDLGPNGLLLINERLSSIGNTTITTDTGGDFFISSAFTGGAGGDCAVGIPCKDDADCRAEDGTGVGSCGGSPRVCQ